MPLCVYRTGSDASPRLGLIAGERVIDVAGAGGPATLSAALQLSAPATSELVDRLVERGSVTRRRDPGDRRQVVVGLTPETRAAWTRKREERLRRLAGVIARLEPEERPGFVRGMMLLVEDISPSGATGCPIPGTEPTLS